VSRKQILRRASSPIACAVTDGASGHHPASTATEAVLIDPVFEQHRRDLSLISELAIDLVASLDTHAHADHGTGTGSLVLLGVVLSATGSGGISRP